MKSLPQFICAAVLAALGLGALLGCGKEIRGEKPVLKVGIIASLTGSGRAWGEVTVNCARAIADYHNERGGLQVGDKRVLIDFLIQDDSLVPGRAVEAAQRIAEEGLHYVIGPLGDDAIVAAAPILDAAGIVFVHYGFQPDLIRQGSLGILAMPMPVQTLPIIFDHLSAKDYVENVIILARDVEEAIFQKNVAKRMADEAGLNILRFSRFDISEETLPPDKNKQQLADRARLIADAEPDALVLIGFPPSEFASIVIQLRETGYEGLVVTQNAQDPEMLREIGPDAGRLYFVGGTLPLEQRSEYYLDLRRRYLELAGSWSDEVDTKLYALEMIIQSVQRAGPLALEQTSMFYELFNEIEFSDPFYKNQRALKLTGLDEFGANRQLDLPILISEFSDGEAHVVIVSTLGNQLDR